MNARTIEDVRRAAIACIVSARVTLEAVFITHAHADHFGGAYLLQQRAEIPVYAPALEAAMMAHPIIEPLYLFSGVIVFTSINEALTRSCTCVVDNGNLIKKVAFPSQLLPVPMILIALMVYLVGAVVCFTVGTIYGVQQPG